jgi:hypothetical protein
MRRRPLLAGFGSVVLLAVVAHAQSAASFSATIGGTSLIGTAPPTLTIGRGAVSLVPPDGNLLWYVPDGTTNQKPTRSQPGAGFHQAITDVPPDEALTVVVQGAAQAAGDPARRLVLTLRLQGATKATLGTFPITAPIVPSGSKPPKIATVVARVTYGPVAYEGARGQVVIDALDLAARRIHGTFAVTTTKSFDGRPAIEIADGQFHVR